MSLPEILGTLTKPMTVLIEKIAGAGFILYEPTHIRKIAQANADAALIKAKSEREITDLDRRAAVRFANELACQQQNIESITQQALPLLDENADPSKMDDDWIANFFDKSRLISDVNMQKLWAKILAGEANNPGYFSRRTVNIVAGIDANDANLFSNLCNFCFEIEVGVFEPIIFNENDDIYKKNEINFGKLTCLDSMGLIKFNTSTTLFRDMFLNKLRISYCGNDIGLNLEKKQNKLRFGRVMFTPNGRELFKICTQKPIEGFLEYSKNKWKDYEPVELVTIENYAR